MNRELNVSGYLFKNMADADRARIEEEKIRQLKDKLQNADTALLYRVYNKSIESRTFRTPVGYDFMKDMKNYLEKQPDCPGEVLPVPLYTTFEHSAELSLDKLYENEKKEKVKIEQNKKEEKKALFLISVFANIILIILVGVMFYIVNTSSSPNIVNYENAIINKYSNWEQELTERENALIQRENNVD